MNLDNKVEYVYFVSSLPALSLEGEVPFNEVYFLDQACAQLSTEHYPALQGTGLKPPFSKRHLLKGYVDYENSLRNTLAKTLGKRKGQVSENFLQEASMFREIPRLVEEVLRLENLVHAQRILDKARWSFLDSLLVNSYFQIEHIAVYYLQLQILWRKELLDFKEGKKQFLRVLDEIQMKEGIKK